MKSQDAHRGEQQKNPRRSRKKSAGYTIDSAMIGTSYISTPVPKIVSLAEESWNYFSKFLCRYQWASDDPSHSPRKTEIAHAILNRGKKGRCTFWRPEGYKYVLPVLH